MPYVCCRVGLLSLFNEPGATREMQATPRLTARQARRLTFIDALRLFNVSGGGNNFLSVSPFNAEVASLRAFLERGCVSVSLAFGASRGERLYFLLGRVRSACRHDVPFAKRPLLTKNLHRQVCPLDTLEFPVLRLPRRKRLREMDNLSDPLSACDLSTGNRKLSLDVYSLFFPASAI